ncbi:MAG: acetylornithine deacetylase [Pseudomonadota bacterium]
MSQMTAEEMLAKLVSFDTTSAKTNLPLIEWVADYLDGHGVVPVILPSDDGIHANLYAHVGPEEPGGVILSGHTDVVPVTGQAWDSDPWVVTERDGRYYGRGTCDMKGFLAIALAAVPTMGSLDRPIQLALSYDEEVGCLGCVPMVKAIAALPHRAEMCIVGEPSMMKAVTGHKGSIGYTTHVRGYEVHSSLVHRGVSAVMNAARMVEWHRTTMAENAADAAGAGSSGYEPPYTTLHVGTIEGGTAGNITARDCRFLTDIRIIPGEDETEWDRRYRAMAAEIEADMRVIHPGTGIDISERMITPALAAEDGGRAEALVRRLTGDNSDNVVSYQTEAGHFQQAGFSTVICGPGSIEQAHQPNEYISVAQFDHGRRFMSALVGSLSAAAA